MDKKREWAAGQMLAVPALLVILLTGYCVAQEAGVEYEGFKEEFNSDASEHFRYGSGGNRAEFTRSFGVPSSIEPDTRVLLLRMDPDDRATPWQGPNLSSHRMSHYGIYTYGFDWEPDRIRWWIIHPETDETIVLWDYQGPAERITQTPARSMMNIWHTDNWPVHTNRNAVERPEHPFGVEFDWVSYTPFVE